MPIGAAALAALLKSIESDVLTTIHVLDSGEGFDL